MLDPARLCGDQGVSKVIRRWTRKGLMGLMIARNSVPPGVLSGLTDEESFKSFQDLAY